MLIKEHMIEVRLDLSEQRHTHHHCYTQLLFLCDTIFLEEEYSVGVLKKDGAHEHTAIIYIHVHVKRHVVP